MDRERLYAMVQSISRDIRAEFPEVCDLPDTEEPARLLVDLGFDGVTLGMLERELDLRLDGRRTDIKHLLSPERLLTVTLGELLDHVSGAIDARLANPEVVYVDDEEDNLFIFKRKFARDLAIKTFSDPRQAAAYIASTPNVGLVITDEVMPGLTGNQLCDEVHAAKPFMKFILITGNPQHDENLMYRSLRANRFFEFIQKPVDFDGKREQYLALIRDILNRAVQ